MKYVLLTIAAALVITGGWSIYSGYPIIAIERGWASVIAGTTALIGGIITFALALVLASLKRLSLALETGEKALPGQPDLPQSAAVVSVSSAAPAAPKAPITQDQEHPIPLEHIHKSVAEAATPIEPALAPSVPPARPAPEPKPFSRVASAFATAATRAREERRTEPSIGELWHRVGVNIDVPFGNDAEALQPKEDPQESEAKTEKSGGRLEHARAKLDIDMPHPLVEEPRPLAPHSPPDQTGEQDVIGRYQADGTSYVMYADGSIEAQSEQGVMRFGSMAELKAFFER